MKRYVKCNNETSVLNKIMEILETNYSGYGIDALLNDIYESLLYQSEITEYSLLDAIYDAIDAWGLTEEEAEDSYRMAAKIAREVADELGLR